MDNIYYAIVLIFIAFCMFGIGVAIYYFYEIYQFQKLSNLIDAEFEKFNDFMPSHWTDDWNSGDDIDEPLAPK